MSRYWVYLNNEVVGPYGVEQLIRLRGFSRQTLVRSEDSSGQTGAWISPAEIPELAAIFKAVDEHQAASSASAVKPAPRPASESGRPAPKSFRPAVVLLRPKRDKPRWRLAFLALAFAAAILFGYLSHHRAQEGLERTVARKLVENAALPDSSLYRTPGSYLDEKHIEARWELERIQDAIYRVTLSWFESTSGSHVYTFETNVQAQTVRGLNTAAVRLLADGFPPPHVPKAKTPLPVKKKPVDTFASSLDSRRASLEQGDVESIWSYFSRRRRAEMARGGMTRDGFLRLQKLTYKVDSPPKQTVLKIKEEADHQRLVLLKQTQAGHPDIFIKQLWINEEGEWKLDDEEKRPATVPSESPQAKADQPSSSDPNGPGAPVEKNPPAPPSDQEKRPPSSKPNVEPARLPGMSH